MWRTSTTLTSGWTTGGEYDPAEAAPIQDSTGAFYGTFSSGGAGKAGILYKVEKLAQSIIVPSIPPKHVGTTIVQGLTATSGLPVSYQVISGPGVLTPQGLKLTATGTVVVKATQPGLADLRRRSARHGGHPGGAVGAGLEGGPWRKISQNFVDTDGGWPHGRARSRPLLNLGTCLNPGVDFLPLLQG